MPDQPLRTTSLTSLHEAAGARMAPFAGWRMPLEFAGTLAEHRAVREDCGVFDVSHLGTVFLRGDRATDVIGHAFTCDPGRVPVGRSQYTLCCTVEGGVVDDLIVYHLDDDSWMVMPNAANTASVLDRLHDAAASVAPATDIDDQSAARAVIAIQGPNAIELATKVLDVDVAAIEPFGLRVSDADASNRAIVGRTGYTGEPGCEVVAPATIAPDLWRALQDAGATPCGLGARDTLRLEMGYPLHGHELSEAVSPYEARMGWAVKLDHDFVGRDALTAAREAAPARRLWGLRTEGRRPLRDDLAVRHGDAAVGTVTSGGFSPTLQVGIGLALLDDPVGPGHEVTVDVRGRDVPATVVKPPFIERGR